MIQQFKKIYSFAVLVILFSACKKDIDPVIVLIPSQGAQVELNGLIGNEPGSAAGKSVFLDLSANKTTAIARASWDLGFYCGSDFRVILNNTAGAGAKVLAKSNLSDVAAADTIGLTLAFDPFNPLPTDLAYYDDIAGSLNGTVIPEISSNENSNKVIIVNRGIGGNIASRPWIKMRVLKNTSGGYTLQYAGITETSFKTIQVPKDAAYHFTFVSFDTGITEGQPEKDKWDLQWSYSVFQANFGAGLVPYNYSDVIAVNHLSNVMVKEKIYADETVAAAAYSAFNKDSATAAALVSGRWSIGSNWRSTQPATGARKDRFYLIRDASGNYYKLKCLAMGVGADGGTRGKPEFKYELIQ